MQCQKNQVASGIPYEDEVGDLDLEIVLVYLTYSCGEVERDDD